MMQSHIPIQNQTLLQQGSFIDGRWRTLASPSLSDHISVTNPFDQQVLAQLHDAAAEDASEAVLAARRAFGGWSALPASQRADMLMTWHDLIMANQGDLAMLLTLEQGKPIGEAKGEVAYGASFIKWFAGEALRVYGDTIPAPNNSQRLMVIKQPVGVVTAITPWNFPNAMITRKAAAALAAGCTFVVRPATETPLSALALGALAQQAGIPDGVFNVVVGRDAAALGEVLTEHPQVDKFTFTGSTRVGKILTAQCAQGVKKVSMELGGNAPFIVFDDADIDAAVAGLMASKFRNAGQTCVCTNRVLVQASVAERFTQAFTDAVSKLQTGNGSDPQTDIGPLISRHALTDIHTRVEDAIRRGAQIHYGGTVPENGSVYPPTVLSGVTNDMPIASEETFGPVAPIITFETEEQGIRLANDTEYGLAAYFYARDIGRVWRVAEGLSFGMVGINEGLISNAAAPFGGMKASGNGREGSRYGLDDYLEIKYLCMGGL